MKVFSESETKPDAPAFSLTTSFIAGFGYGFGGAEVVEIANLPEVSSPGDIVFYGVDEELNRSFGWQNPGAASYVREKTVCMMPWTQVCARACHDIGIVTTNDSENIMQAVRSTNNHLTIIGRKPALIGCDHTVSMACAMGVADGSRKPFVYLYFDAHYDLGLHGIAAQPHNGNFVNTLLGFAGISEIVNVGGRCWSSFAPVYNNIPGFTNIPGGIKRTSPGEIIEKLAWLEGKSVYVSIDADILDPACAPNVTCPEPFGMSTENIYLVCEWIGKNCNVAGSDLSEIVPSDHSIGAEQALVQCIHALFPKNT